MEIATDPLRHNNGVIDTKMAQFNCCENAWSAATRRDGEKEGKIFEESEPFLQVRSWESLPAASPSPSSFSRSLKWDRNDCPRMVNEKLISMAWMDGWKCPQPPGQMHERKLSCHPLLLEKMFEKRWTAVMCMSQYLQCWKQRVDWACLSSVPYGSDWCGCGEHCVLGWSITRLSHRGRRDPLCQRRRHFFTEMDLWKGMCPWSIVHTAAPAEVEVLQLDLDLFKGLVYW